MANIVGSNQRDIILEGTDDPDVIRSLAGGDIIRPRLGSDVVDGGDGFDFVFYDDQLGAFTFTFGPGAAGTAAADDNSKTDSLTNVEAIRPSDFGDTFNILAGFDGSEGAFFQAQSGAGDDTINADPSITVRITYDGATGGAVVNLGSGVGTAPGRGTDTLINVTDVIGTDFDDVLVGSNNANPGAFGRESFRVLDGDDFVNGRGGVDRLDYRFGEAVVVDMVAGRTIKANGAGTDTFFNIENILGSLNDDIIDGDGQANVLEGQDGDDIIRGNGGADELRGEIGNDVLFGGAGTDTLDGGAGIDVAGYELAGTQVVARLDRGAITADGGTDQLISIEGATGGAFNDVLVGDAGRNILNGGGGNDRLIGGAGDDDLIGGAGNDTYTVEDSTDVVIEEENEGIDRINAFADFTNPDNIEFLVGIFAETGLRLIGNEGRDRISGSNIINSGDVIAGLNGNDKLVGLVGNDRFDGGAGNDRIFGNSGDDIIRGAAGNDRLTGQFGRDTFIHNPGHGRDGITDFDVDQDILDLTQHDFASFAEVQAAMGDTARGVLIDLSGGAFQGLASREAIIFERTTLATFDLGQEDVLI